MCLVRLYFFDQCQDLLKQSSSISGDANSDRAAWMSQDELVNEMRKQIAALEKTNKTQLQDNADEINRLHRSLKESQQECRELLEAR